MGGEGVGVLTKYSRGADTCMYMWYPIDIYKTHACTVMIEVHADMCMECRGIYSM